MLDRLNDPLTVNEDSNIEKDLFAEALELPPEQREVFLKGACRGDERLRQRVEGLLRVQLHSVVGASLIRRNRYSGESDGRNGNQTTLNSSREEKLFEPALENPEAERAASPYDASWGFDRSVRDNLQPIVDVILKEQKSPGQVKLWEDSGSGSLPRL